ncbi:MAG TPA: hypothetical protein GXX75_12625 [Clostridiales bacterium]|nr:hypothetical protein [Clostridiales bacterium]
MVLKNAKIYCLMLFGMFLFTGCGMDSGLQISKANMELKDTIDFMICWPEESLRGSKIKRLVDNYNLLADEKSKINLVTISDREDYMAELKTLAATNELPDIFICIRNREDLFLEESGKLMNLAPYQEELNYEEKRAKNIPGDFYNQELLSICFEIPALRFYYLKDMADSYGYPFVSNDPKLLYKMYDHILKSENGILQIEDYISSGEGLSFLYFLRAQNKDFDSSNEEDWENILKIWKHYSKVFGTFKNQYTPNETGNNIKLCNINNAAFSEPWTEASDLYNSVILSDKNDQTLFGSPLCLAALRQNDKEKEEKVICFISSFLEENWSDIQKMDLPENQLDLFDDTVINVTESENLDPRQKDEMKEVLRMLLMETMDYQECARIIAKYW